ncbi:MAG: tol-pal system protein YbgF [Pseudomonadota bacterium]|jgi:tol-pal system protein YbgF|nr:tol-pal system protein YbgF [Pseudomonadota bacterium]
MFKAPALVLAGFCLFASPAIAQRGAPITQGVTSSDLSQQVAQARQQSAQVQVEVNGLTGDVMQLTGRVETLEFQLQQARETSENLQRDNEALIDEVDTLRARLEGQSGEIASLRSALAAAGLVPETDPELGPAPGEFGTLAEPDMGGSSAAGPRRLDTPSAMSMPSAGAEPSGPTRLTPAGDTSGSQALPEGSLGTISASALPGEAGPLFALAKSRLIQFDYAGAEEAFRAFLEEFGDDPQAGEAYYWLGESLYQQKAYADSGAAYTTMIRSYPDDPRAADALVKLARAMRLIGDKEKACLALGTLPNRYPDASVRTRDLAAVERTRSGCDN